MKQYAASPVIQQLIADRTTYFPVVWQQQFYDVVWNVDTAQNFGLDIWGRIVNIGRYLQVPDSGYFGFNTSPDQSWSPFNQQSFYNGVAATSTFRLEDNAYRTLILAKALANISSTSAKSLNNILKNLFPDRGRCYVNDLGSMQMRYTFEFDLQPWEKTVLVSGGALPRPAGVQASVAAIPSGTTFGFAEQGIGRVYADPAPQIFRSDWQGSRLLYTTPRTNYYLFNQDLSNGYWNKGGSTITASASIFGVPFWALTPSATLGAHNLGTSAVNLPAGSTASISWLAAPNGYSRIALRIAPGGVLLSRVIFDLSNVSIAQNNSGIQCSISSLGSGVCLITATFPLGSGVTRGDANLEVADNNNSVSFTGDGSSGVLLSSPQIEDSQVPTSIIPTFASPVTVTDYAATTLAVTLSSPLQIGANLLWTGTYTSALTGQTIAEIKNPMGTGDGATSTFAFSGKFIGGSVAPFNQGTFLSTGAVANAN